MANIVSIGTPTGPGTSSCGYCIPRSTGTSWRIAGLDAMQLSCEVYQRMIDRGWRRSGTWCYKPNLRISCCPQYTIKLDALAFKPSKSQRKLVNRWNRFVVDGTADESMDIDQKAGAKVKISKKPKAHTLDTPFALTTDIHSSESTSIAGADPKHKFEVLLEPSSYTPEKYALFQKYQLEIHDDPEKSPSGFKRFLVHTPLRPVPIPYFNPPPAHLPTHYGSHHQLYRLDGQLIAMAVIDILPDCVSSVYFMYDKAWEKFSLGKLSALREVSLAKEIKEAGAPRLSHLYLGFYIHSCQKMRYKGDYSPSFLADPESYDWYPLEQCRPLLDKNRYACFSNPGHSIEGFAPSETPEQEPVGLDDDVLEDISMLNVDEENQVSVIPVNSSPYWQDEDIRSTILSCVSGLGVELAKDIFFAF